MKEKILAAAVLSFGLIGAAVPASAQDTNGSNTKHVLLISIDGMHAVDYENCVASKTCPNLAALGRTGVHYTRTTTSRPSDSFPGLMAIVTGGSPRTVGAFYDVAQVTRTTTLHYHPASQIRSTERRPNMKRGLKSTRRSSMVGFPDMPKSMVALNQSIPTD